MKESVILKAWVLFMKENVWHWWERVLLSPLGPTLPSTWWPTARTRFVKPSQHPILIFLFGGYFGFIEGPLGTTWGFYTPLNLVANRTYTLCQTFPASYPHCWGPLWFLSGTPLGPFWGNFWGHFGTLHSPQLGGQPSLYTLLNLPSLHDPH